MDSLLYYEICFILSVVLSFIYICVWHDGIDVNMTCLFILIPIVCLGCVWMYWAPSLDIAIIANKIVYIAGCFWPLFSTKTILSLCNLKIKKKYTIIAFAISFIFYYFALNTEKPGALYKSLSYLVVDGRYELYPEYGWMHTVIYVSMVIYIIIGVAALIYGMKNKLRASIKNMQVMLVGEVGTIIIFFIYGLRNLAGSPAAIYVFSQMIFLYAGYRSYYYNIDDSVMDTIITEGTLGYVTFDKKKRLLGCNEVAERLFPELKTVRTDKHFDNLDGVKQIMSDCIEQIEMNGSVIEKIIPLQGKSILMKVDDYRLRGNKYVYRFVFSDDTDHQNLVQLLNKEKDLAEKESKHATDTLNRYIDPNIVNKILRNENTEAIEKNVTVLFADVRGFTTFSENKTPKEVLNVLNLIIETMTTCVMKNGGIVDKIIGDCVMAIWNNDDAAENDMYNACKTALQMQESIKNLGAKTAENYGISLHVGVGINNGTAIVGNVGTTIRSDYTAIGDAVNVASRLESVAGPDEILVTTTISEALKDKAIFSVVNEKAILKGRIQNTTVLKLEKLN